jgi:hypothetical protein
MSRRQVCLEDGLEVVAPAPIPDAIRGVELLDFNLSPLAFQEDRHPVADDPLVVDVGQALRSTR